MNTTLIKNLIYKYKTSKINFYFVQKNKNLFIVDGNIKYNINKNKLSCPCSKFLCEHIIYYLTNVIGLNINNLIFFNKIKTELINIFNNETNNIIINNKINDYLKSELECIICLCSIQDYKYNNYIVECINCHNFCHKYCFELYKSKSGIVNNTCIYCKTNNMI